MKRYWDQLKPVERRWAAGILGIVFLLLNYFFIWPHFGDWKRDEFRLKRAHDTNEIYSAEVRHINEYKRLIAELQTSSGDQVLPEDQAIDFIRFLNGHTVENAIIVTSQGNLVTHTNDYSIDQQVTIGAQATETNLVKFLYSLSAGGSMVRVRSMNLHPEPSHQQLGAGITLIASYQKKLAARGTGTAAPRGTTAAPQTAPAPKTVSTPAPPAPKGPPPAANSPAYANKMAALSNHSALMPRISRGTNNVPGPFSHPTAPTNNPGQPIPRRP